MLSYKKLNSEYESKFQKLLAEFAQVRAKAQEMLVQKDNEIKRLREKTIAGRAKNKQQNENNSGIDSDEDALTEVYKSDGSSSDEDEDLNSISKKDRSSTPELDNTSRAFVKNVLMKYLEYSANQQDKESMMMEKVLFTALKVHENDIKILEDARLKNYNQGFMSYIWAPDPNLVAHPVKPRAYNPSENKKFHK